MMWLLYVLLALAIAWLWFFLGSHVHCPSCGVELPDAFGYPGQRNDHCPRCGWQRG